MAKVTSTLDITLLNEEMVDTVYKINNPTSNVTLSNIRLSYAPMLGNGGNSSSPSTPENSHLMDKNGKKYIFVSSAKITTTTITTTDVN